MHKPPPTLTDPRKTPKYIPAHTQVHKHTQTQIEKLQVFRLNHLRPGAKSNQASSCFSSSSPYPLLFFFLFFFLYLSSLSFSSLSLYGDEKKKKRITKSYGRLPGDLLLVTWHWLPWWLPIYSQQALTCPQDAVVAHAGQTANMHVSACVSVCECFGAALKA